MLLSLDWLKEFVNMPRSLGPEDLAAKLTFHTVEVEKVVNQADTYRQVVVGKILKVEKHPNADRLQLAQVNIGTKVLSIVCGAPNIQTGQTVPVALVGAELPNGAVIQEAEVRGVKSEGMLCAPDELGLGDDHSGILILDKRAKAGEALAKFLGLNQVVLEVDNKSLSNRPDLWSHQGMAREIAATCNLKFMPYTATKKLLAKTEVKDKLEVVVEDFKLCPRYMAITLEGIKISPSPEWLVKRLVAVGARPINNIVDITNYVMFELGQPLHAFDRALVDKIIVRPARDGEAIETLDGEKRILDKERLVIADSKKPLAIAGVMGGATSEISDKTTAIMIEAANFDFASIRKTSQKLSLRTESSMRFEKGLDRELAETGLLRAVELIKKLCPEARITSGLIDQKSASVGAKQIELNFAWLERLLGARIKPDRIREILISLGFSVKPARHASPASNASHSDAGWLGDAGGDKDQGLSVTVPSWRATRDIEAQEDLAEEVARIYGYNNIQSQLPLVRMAPPETIQEGRLVRKIKAILSGGAAMTEVYNYSFVGEEQLKKLFIDPKSHLTLLNPLASNQALLRQSLAPNLLENVKTNQPRYSEIAIFEIGNVFFSSEGEDVKDNDGGRLPYQEKRLGLALANDDKGDLLRQLKGAVEFLIAGFGLPVSWLGSKIAPSWAENQASAQIIVAGKMIGTVNLLAAKIGKNLGLKKKVALAEISLPQFNQAVNQAPARQFEEFEKYPPLTRDLAFVVDAKILFSELWQEIAGFSELIRRADFFDVYQGGKLGEKNKSLAFHVIYQAADRTLTSEEVDSLQKGLIKRLEEKYGAKVRDF
jgi:phenylalanyl-tRNA synthetase beta chain